MMEKIEQIREELPNVIGLPRCNVERRPYSFDDLVLDDVRGPIDLPPYLIFGVLLDEGFKETETGWCAHWGDVETGTYFEVDFNQSENRVFIRQFWCGVEGSSTISPSGRPLGRLIGQVLYSQFPHIWDEAAAKGLEGRFRIKYVPFQEGMTITCGIPDGVMKTLCIPLGIGDLRSFILDWDKMITEEHFSFPIAGYIKKINGTVNYVQGQSPEWACDQSEVLRKSVETTGFMPFHGPIIEHSKNGSGLSAMTVYRLVYLTFITVPFAGLIPLIEALNKAGWLLDKQDKPQDETPKDGIEFTPFVAHGTISMETSHVAFSNETLSRRATWVMPENKEEVLSDMLSSGETSLEDAVLLASKAEDLGLQAIRTLAGNI
jgi:hypothetical protein